MCLRFVFLLITRIATWLRLSRRDDAWNTAEILILRHQLAILRRHRACRPSLNWAGPSPARGPVRRDTESAPSGTAVAGHPGYDHALAPRHRPAPLGGVVGARQVRPPGDPLEYQGPGPPNSPGEPEWGYRRIHGEPLCGWESSRRDWAGPKVALGLRPSRRPAG
jgi:putative transposase